MPSPMKPIRGRDAWLLMALLLRWGGRVRKIPAQQFGEAPHDPVRFEITEFEPRLSKPQPYSAENLIFGDPQLPLPAAGSFRQHLCQILADFMAFEHVAAREAWSESPRAQKARKKRIGDGPLVFAIHG